jgi:hypothetical protein
MRWLPRLAVPELDDDTIAQLQDAYDEMVS